MPNSPQHTGSLVTRLTAWYAGSSLLLILATVALLDWSLSTTVESDIAVLASTERNELSEIFEESPVDFHEIHEEVQRSQSEHAQTRIWMRIAGESDPPATVETRGMSELGMTAGLIPATAEGKEWKKGVPLTLPAGLRVRGFAARVRTVEGAPYRIEIFVDAGRSEQLLTRYHSRVFKLVFVALLVASIVGYVIGRQGLRPLQRIAATMEDIDTRSLERRVPLDGLPRELQVLGMTFNRVLDRLDDAFVRLERSSADIAHELRTPLARMRLGVELALQKLPEGDPHREALGACLEEADDLSRLIDKVLFLARTHGPLDPARAEAIDLSPELARLEEFYGPAAAERTIRLSVDCTPELRMAGDRRLVLRAIGNLVENAIEHTPEGGSIVVRAWMKVPQIHISVRDTGRGIPEEDQARVFEPFARAAPDRSRSSGGAGLGLAIVKKIVELHGGTVSLESQPRGGTIVTMRFPI